MVMVMRGLVFHHAFFSGLYLLDVYVQAVLGESVMAIVT